ncbi:DUF5810 domain-containing protein [Halobellus salinisoli]|uniref:DUF5810 domain-containing protein n=1 Tax=Halobellus salinisoli TaxID=3108500 RepID=UPI003008170D
MGFACPVCESPQQDATHLANHLAFTAMVHGDEHETWLDEHVPDWETHGESELAPEVAELADETDYEQVFEDTAQAHGHGGNDHQHGRGDHSRGSGHGDAESSTGIDPELAAAAGSGTLDEETKAILEEARELTAEMLGQGDGADRDAESSADEDDTESRD